MLNRDWLKTFRRLVETGHFTQTARQLNMTQPGVSQHIQKLEAACRHPLLHRDKKQFELTEQGKLLYLHAKKLDEIEENLFQQLNIDDPNQGNCTISCSGSLALRLYPEFLSLQQKFPQLHIYLETAPNHKILNDIKEGTIDLGIVTEKPDKRTYKTTLIGQDELCLITPKNSRKNSNLIEYLSELGLIDHPDAHHYASIYFDQCGLELSATILKDIPISGYVNQLSQILLPVSKGIGFTILPKSAVLSFSNVQDLEIISPKKKVQEQLLLITTSQKTLPARYQHINKIIHETIGIQP